MKIPNIIHQTWKIKEIPSTWKSYQQKVKILHPDWEYKLWTDAENNDFVKLNFPDFYPKYISYPNNIMRADVIRYLIMYKIGGFYLDLDYEIFKPFDFEDALLVLPKNRGIEAGDPVNMIGNAIFASVPGHIFWKDVISYLASDSTIIISNEEKVIDTTGPGLLTKIYFSKIYQDIYVPDRMIFHPPTPKNRKEYNAIIQNGISYGIHHCWGSWRKQKTIKHLIEKYFKKK